MYNAIKALIDLLRYIAHPDKNYNNAGKRSAGTNGCESLHTLLNILQHF